MFGSRGSNSHSQSQNLMSCQLNETRIARACHHSTSSMLIYMLNRIRTYPSPFSASVWSRTKIFPSSVGRLDHLSYRGIFARSQAPCHRHHKLFSCKRRVGLLRIELRWSVKTRGLQPRQEPYLSINPKLKPSRFSARPLIKFYEISYLIKDLRRTRIALGYGFYCLARHHIHNTITRSGCQIIPSDLFLCRPRDLHPNWKVFKTFVSAVGLRRLKNPPSIIKRSGGYYGCRG